MFRLFRSRETLSSTGFTMIELIIVIGILSAIIASILFSFRTSYLRGMDARRKSDLQAYKIALERYYDENDEYPDPTLRFSRSPTVSSCGAVRSDDKKTVRVLSHDPAFFWNVDGRRGSECNRKR